MTTFEHLKLVLMLSLATNNSLNIFDKSHKMITSLKKTQYFTLFKNLYTFDQELLQNYKKSKKLFYGWGGTASRLYRATMRRQLTFYQKFLVLIRSIS